MIETMIDFRPQEVWPRRKLSRGDAQQCTDLVLDELERRKWIAPVSADNRGDLISESAAAQEFRFDAILREIAYQRNLGLLRELAKELPLAAARDALRQALGSGASSRSVNEGDIALLASTMPPALAKRLAIGPTELEAAAAERWLAAELRRRKLLTAGKSITLNLLPALRRRHRDLWREHAWQLDCDLAERAPGLLARLAIEDLLARRQATEPQLAGELSKLRQFRHAPAPSASRAGHHGSIEYSAPQIDPLPLIDGLQGELTRQVDSRIGLIRARRQELAGFGGEMDQALQMPGWTNVWTMPIQNRVDMLATGVNTTVGVRVLGERLDDVVEASRLLADLLQQVPGAASVVADPVRGKGYLDIRLDSDAASRHGVRHSDANAVIEAALGGTVATELAAGRQRLPVRVRLPAAAADDVEAIRRLEIKSPGRDAVYLGQVAEIAVTEGPASIKSENGRLRNYVRLNVVGRDAEDFVREARQLVVDKLALPRGVHLEWTGQFEHQIRARQRLWLVAPLALLVILTILYLTYRDVADALLLVPAIVGALAGGLLLQWLLGYKSSVTVAVGYIACFGMAASTGIIMLVYLRDAVEQAGGLARMSLAELREAVVRGAAHRLRPKLLTEATTILGLAPLLWATGAGSEVIRPMIAPVLGGILVADEVIDLLLPVMFYWVRKRRWQRMHSSPADDGLEESPDLPITPALQESLG
jgi:Cu(I)/Ag(I) efflux system membrane protein CusA/SilA